MRTTLDLPDPLFHEIKSQAATRGMKLKDLIAELLVIGLTRQKSASLLHNSLPFTCPSIDRISSALPNGELEKI